MKEALRTACHLLLESSVQPNLQASVLAVQKAAGGDVDSLTVISIVLSLLVAVYNLVITTINFLVVAKDVQAMLPMDQNDRPRVYVRNHRRLLCATIICAVSIVGSTLLIVYALVKTCFAVFICEQGVWNVSGCVDIEF